MGILVVKSIHRRVKSLKNKLGSLTINIFEDMSVKVKDVLNVFKQNKLDRALGLLEPQPRYRVETNQQTSTSTPSQCWNQQTPKKEPNTSMTDSSVTSTWNHNNIARTEEGTTFYFRQKLS